MKRLHLLVSAAVLFVFCLPAEAQMSETFRSDQSSLVAKSVMDIYFCEVEGGFKFSLYDKRINPPRRLLLKYDFRGLEAGTGKMKRAKDRTACAGAPESSIISESITVEPIPVPDEEDSLWVLSLRLEGNLSLPVAVSKKGLPFMVSIQYHPETLEFEVLQ